MLVEKLEKYAVYCILTGIFLFPLFVLPWSEGQTELSKFILLILTITPATALLVAKNIINKDSWKINGLDIAVLGFSLIHLVSTVNSPGNRMFNFTGETLPIIISCLVYFAIRLIPKQENSQKILMALVFGIGVMAGFILFQQYIQQKTLFTPINGQQTQVFYTLTSLFNSLKGILVLIPIGFGLGIAFLSEGNENHKKEKVLSGLFISIGFLLTITTFSLLPSTLKTPNGASPGLNFLDFNSSWKIMFESFLSYPLLGIGPGNYIDAFTRFKPIEFNQSPYWNYKYGVGNNVPLTVGVTTGLFGLVIYGILVILVVKLIQNLLKSPGILEKALAVSLGICVLLELISPTSFIPLTIFMILLSLGVNKQKNESQNIQIPSFIISLLLTIIGTGIFMEFLVVNYRSQIFASKASDALKRGDGIQTLNYLKNAKKLTPYIENYYLVSSQINMTIANNIAQNSSPGTPSGKLDDKTMKDIQVYINASLGDLDKLLNLAPNRSMYYEEAARRYQSLIGVVQNASTIAANSYDKAIENDPNNPLLYINLGGMFFGTKEYATASALFIRAVSLKPEYNNAHYNLAYTLFQLKQYDNAIMEMEKAISLTDKKSADYARAQNELKLFISQKESSLNQASPQNPEPSIVPLKPIDASNSAQKQVPGQNQGLNLATGSAVPIQNNLNPLGGNGFQIPPNP